MTEHSHPSTADQSAHPPSHPSGSFSKKKAPTVSGNNAIHPKANVYKKRGLYSSNSVVPVSDSFDDVNSSQFKEGTFGNEQDHSFFEDKIQQFFMFINALKLERSIHPLLCLSLHLMMIYQTLSLGISVDDGWGEYGRYIVHALVAPRTFGFQFLPYNGFVALFAIMCLVECIGMIIIFFTYRSLIYGSKYWKKIRTAGRSVFAIMTFLSLPMTFALMQGFWGCDYSKTVEIQKGVQIFVLSSFPTEACWGTMNAVFSILSLILVLIQVVITMGTVMIFCDTFITSKAKFLLLDPFLISYVIGSNQLYLIISIVTPKFVSFLRPIYFAIFSLGFVILLFRNLPFVRRRANSVYGGVGFARIGVAVASLIASLVNASDSWDLGLGLAFCPPVLALIGFVIGFLVTDFYTKYLFNRGHEMVKLALTHDTRIHNRDFKAVCAFLQFSMKGINEHKRLVSDFIETSQHADWLDAHMKVLFSLFFERCFTFSSLLHFSTTS
ncbi:hypothetical protein FDP41_002182 [Naegleria fowleri]|uniref:Transmembrane protein n=1 Tax=Naegleria fowleri TaxID=5763 RepID=A0A6A5BWT8_NAEFO|nr:uncharacterized protein FDP41_002182 [Naegleria fowleri]KAF0979112.1 hypothetical protein FDP41_002182 [Naegleria fowleri]